MRTKRFSGNRYPLGAITIFIFLLLLLQISHAKIVFTSERSDGKTRQLYVMNDNGSNVHRLINTEFYDRRPRWFPDGKQILFERDLSWGNGAEYNTEFYVLSVKRDPEEHKVPNTHPTDYHPVLSPDGKRIAFTSKRASEDWEIYLMNLDGSNLKQLTHRGWKHRADWFPDGKQIAYEFGESILVINTDGTKEKLITPEEPINAFTGAPYWSPSGKYIMYVETIRNLVNLKMVAKRLIIYNVATGKREIHDFPTLPLIASGCWMGDDRTVLLSLKDDLVIPTASYDIYRYDLDSRRLTNLTKQPADDYHPHWYPGPLSVFPLDKLPVVWGHLKQME